MAKVSIVVPIYNVEKYLTKCLTSLMNQTLQDIEIIAVDDGSPDNCGRILDELAQQDSRIVALHQENGGYGKAVNAGIERAKGEYIGIVEPDDWCNLDMFEKLYKRAKELDCDVCKCDFNYYFGNGRYKKNNAICQVADEGEVFTIKEKPLLMKVHVSIWSAIYKKTYLDTNDIRVLETAKASYQDMPFAANVYSHGAKITLIHEALLNYRSEENMNSSTKRSDERLKLMPVMCNAAKKYFMENDCWNEVKEAAYIHFYNCSFGMWMNTKDEFKKAHYEELRNLFANILNENVKFTCFNDKQKKILGLIIDDKYDELLKYAKKQERKENKKRFMQKVFYFNWNKREKRVSLFGVDLIKK